MMWRYALLWLPMVALAVLNGVIRDYTYQPYIGELAGHQVSTATGIALFGVYIWLVMRKWRPRSMRQAFAVGLLWLALTLAFEFLFFHYVAGHPWERLLAAYDLRAGRVWILVLVWVTAAPPIFYLLTRPRGR